MTETEMRIAIAEACGIKTPRIDLTGSSIQDWNNGWRCPNYPQDLNACLDMQNVLKGDQKLLYVDALLAVIHKVDSGYFSHIGWSEGWDIVHATAHQRCEAFLRTLSLWKV